MTIKGDSKYIFIILFIFQKMTLSENVKSQLREMATAFDKWRDDKTNPDRYYQEKFPYFYSMIKLVLDMKTESQIDLHCLTKYQCESILKDVFYGIAEFVGNNPKPFEIIVGKGNNSPDGPQLQKKVEHLCKLNFALKVFCKKNSGVYSVEISPGAGHWIRMMRDIQSDINLLQELDGENKAITRILNGFCRDGFNPIVLKYWDMEMTNIELIRKVWTYIINLTSARFLFVKEKSLLKELDPKLFNYLVQLYQRKPKSLKELFPRKLTPGRKLYIIYTFVAANRKMKFDIICDENNITEHLSPSEKKVKELTNIDKNLFLRFDEKSADDNTLEIPIYKKLRNIKEIIDTNKTHSKSVLLIIHLNEDSEKDSNFLPYDSEWEQFMIDSLFN